VAFAANCGELWHFAAFCCELRRFAANCGELWRFAAFCGVLLQIVAFCGELRRFAFLWRFAALCGGLQRFVSTTPDDECSFRVRPYSKPQNWVSPCIIKTKTLYSKLELNVDFV